MSYGIHAIGRTLTIMLSPLFFRFFLTTFDGRDILLISSEPALVMRVFFCGKPKLFSGTSVKNLSLRFNNMKSLDKLLSVHIDIWNLDIQYVRYGSNYYCLAVSEILRLSCGINRNGIFICDIDLRNWRFASNLPSEFLRLQFIFQDSGRLPTLGFAFLLIDGIGAIRILFAELVTDGQLHHAFLLAPILSLTSIVTIFLINRKSQTERGILFLIFFNYRWKFTGILTYVVNYTWPRHSVILFIYTV